MPVSDFILTPPAQNHASCFFRQIEQLRCLLFLASFLRYFVQTSNTSFLFFIQTEAERRRREAGVQQSIENGLGSCMYVYMFVCMGFANIWGFRAPSESKMVPYDSHVSSTLLRHEIIGMWLVPDERVARDRSLASTFAESVRAKYSTHQFYENFW